MLIQSDLIGRIPTGFQMFLRQKLIMKFLHLSEDFFLSKVFNLSDFACLYWSVNRSGSRIWRGMWGGGWGDANIRFYQNLRKMCMKLRRKFWRVPGPPPDLSMVYWNNIEQKHLNLVKIYSEPFQKAKNIVRLPL